MTTKPIHIPGKHWLKANGVCVMCGVTSPQKPVCSRATVGALVGMELAERRRVREAANYVRSTVKRKKVEV